MRKTIRDVLSCPGFEEVRLAAGAQGLDRPVGGATLMEVPDIFPYLDRDFLLITTLYPIADSPGKLDAFIPQLAERGVAGICIKPMRYVRSIPDTMLQQADQLGFPLMELPENANLSTLVNAVHSMSLNDYIGQLQFRDNVHQSLMRQMLEGAEVAGLAKNLAQLLNNTVIVLDKGLSATCSVQPGEGGDWVVREQELAGGSMASLDYLDRRYLIYPIKAGTTSFGYIFLPDADKGDANLRMAVEQAAMLFAAVFFKDDAVAQNQRNFKDVFIRDLLQGKIESEMELENKMRAFNLQMDFPQYTVCLRLHTDNEMEKKAFYNDIMDQRFLERQMDYFFGGKRVKNIVYFNDALVILEQAQSEGELLDFYTSVSKKLEGRAGAGSKVGIGISQGASSFVHLAAAYRQAVDTVRLGGQLHGGSYVLLHSRMGVFDLVQRLPDELLLSFVARRLGPVIDYDRHNGTNLMETLQLLVREGMSFKRAAQAAFVHYNTIRYRAAKLQELGVALEPGRELGELVLALDSYLWLKAKHIL